jgi:hypothetical protein
VIVNLFKTLEENNFGKYTIGRREQKTRFISSELSLNQLAEKVLGKDQILEKEDSRQNVVEKNVSQNDLESNVARDERDTVDYPFPLRPNLTITLTLPTNLTDSEADRLAGFIKALPMK